MKSEIAPARPTAATAPRSWQFASTWRGVRLTRVAVTKQLAEWGWAVDTETTQNAALLVAELAANAVVHGRVPGRDFRVRLSMAEPPAAEGGAAGPATLRVEVADSRGDRLPAPRTVTDTDAAGVGPDSGAESGRGLVLVDALASRWGSVPRPPSGKTVWAELHPTEPRSAEA
ncbi:ATP-binding protein [Kitasatospora sp. NBC_00240]|uniref:ATP-binding protein n=1 Tax=Kitasatospora sp. NBC_00240 TaxID=2903567 RepID=UPI00225B0361|nr:ATP-binding protein [Kitasatospora sp. NBC_00240]MCX5209888.1 ATP-binding protein [Kitasatospora sp. NBC_00240]